MQLSLGDGSETVWLEQRAIWHSPGDGKEAEKCKRPFCSEKPWTMSEQESEFRRLSGRLYSLSALH